MVLNRVRAVARTTRSQHMKSKITQALVERAPAPEKGKSVLHADTEMRGFYLIVTPTKRSFYVQSLVNGKQVRTKLGDHPSMDAKQARVLRTSEK